MSADWSRHVATTIKKFIPGETVNTMRQRKTLAMLQSRGTVTMNGSGRAHQERIRKRRAPMSGFAQGDTLSFGQIDRWAIAEIDWRGYAMAEGQGKYERLINKGKEAIINHYSKLPQMMLDDFMDNLAEEIFLDGSATGNEKRFHGIESALGANVSLTRPFVANPDDNYRGLDTDLGASGGTWSGTWPNGRGSAEYDYWSPILVNYTDNDANGAAWEATEKTWINTCLEAVSFGLLAANRSKAKKGAIDTIMFDRELFRLFRQRLYERYRIQVEHNSSNSPLIKLGFGDVINWEGVDISTEYGMTPAVGYGFNWDMIELISLQDQLVVPEGPDYDIGSKTYRFSLDLFGNLIFNPRSLLKFGAYS